MTHHQCIITGCGLFLEGADSGAWGDLYIAGDQMIFVGNLAPSFVGASAGGTLEWSRDLKRSDCRGVHIRYGTEYLERRGVLVFAADPTLLNRKAQDYIGPERMKRYFNVKGGV